VEIPRGDSFPEVRFSLLTDEMMGYTIPNDIEICSSTVQFHLLELHDILQLNTDLSGLSQQFRMQKVLESPVISITKKVQWAKYQTGRMRKGSYW